MKCNFTKPAISFESQLRKLKDKKLIIENDDKAIELLKSINYYRLRGYYIHLYDNSIEEFHSKASFEQIIDLHEFDMKLIELTAAVILKIEISMRAKIAYIHSCKYGGLGYTRQENFYNPKYHEELISKVTNSIEDSSEIFKQHFKNKYNNKYPLWAVVELLSMTNLSKLYKNMLNIDSRELAKTYFDFSEVALVSSNFEYLSLLRNICAHGGRLYNRVFSKQAVLLKEHQSLYNRPEKNTYYAGLFSIKYLAPTKTIFNEFILDLDLLINKHKNYIEISRLGLPDDWKQNILT